MVPIEYRWMAPDEVDRIAGIDRAEVIRKGYRMTDGGLEAMEVEWDAVPWLEEADHSHSVQAQIDFCKGHLSQGAVMFGGFDGDRLVGIGLLRWDVQPGVSQLAFLHTSNGYRRQGIGDKITQMLIAAASERGDREIYVSATPSESAVGFYLKHGFVVADEPIAELLALEPEDIHMRLDLTGERT